MDSRKVTRQLIRIYLKILTGLRQGIWQHLHLKRTGTICFFEKNFDLELFLKKDAHIFLSAMKKKFCYKKLKITTTGDTKLNF